MRQWLLALAIFLGAFACFVGCDRGSSNPTEVPNTWQEARTMPGHVAHLGKNHDGRAIVCGDCHAEKDGFKSPGTEPCAKCHAENAKNHHKGGKDKPTTCLTCHMFTPHEGKTAAPACTDCHTNDHAQHAKAPCASCHAPHGEPRTVNADCTSCHTSTSANHGTLAVVATSDAGLVDAAPSRDGGMPAGDAAIADLPHAAASPTGVCSACHAPHKPAAEAKTACASCHVNKNATGTLNAFLASKAAQIKPGLPKVASHEACTTCHKPHDAKASAVPGCATCHGNKTAIASVKGHANCQNCHQPHAPSSAPLACEGCHKKHDALGADKIAPHNNCASCHNVHAPGTKAAGSCIGCHTKITPKHPPAKGGACIGCHAPHPADTKVTVATCTSCHAKVAPNDHKLHAGVECSKCHAKHEFKLVSSPALCGGCHAPIAAKVLKPGHATCTSCHGSAHTPQKNVACNKCHAAEVSTAPKGHSNCTTCHDSHAGGLFAAGKATTPAAICSTCHAEKSKTHHGSVAGGCASCHRPHGPKGVASPPACTSCHAVDKLPGLHAAKSHAANCTSCHGGHTPTHADRPSCTGTCHQNKKDHQPGATVCSGCHIFTKFPPKK